MKNEQRYKGITFAAGRFLFAAVIFAASWGSVFAGGGSGESRRASGGTSLPKDSSIAVFIPGVMSGSPIYGMLADGVRNAAADFSEAEGREIRVNVIEAGYNQAEWESKLTALAASGSYGLIVSSNPSLPAIAESVSAKFPQQKFLLLDGEIEGRPTIYTMRYNQREQAYIAGHIAALVSLDLAAGGRPSMRIGLVAGQEYPVMDNIIRPGYEEGAKAVDQGFTVDFRVVGNWFDAGKGAELALDMIRGGAQVILCVAGGANEGVVKAASETGKKAVWFDTNGYNIMPGTVVGSSVLYQEKAAYEKTMLFLKGALPFGKAEVVGIADGYVDFIEDDPLYTTAVSEAARAKQAALLARIRSGEFRLED
ncbi:MAG: BMP family ABC transporter substrate-binding protein [Treponema sp.]|jgi:simple sugar transport system substrate-binding protein|nr:BMP family ABC transporter substrate-binding protein [Treponema sp.]